MAQENSVPKWRRHIAFPVPGRALNSCAKDEFLGGTSTIIRIAQARTHILGDPDFSEPAGVAQSSIILEHDELTAFATLYTGPMTNRKLAGDWLLLFPLLSRPLPIPPGWISDFLFASDCGLFPAQRRAETEDGLSRERGIGPITMG